MKIYEVMFYGDSPHETPFICGVKEETEYKKFALGVHYHYINAEKLELKIIQDGIKDNFLKNTEKLLIIDEKVKNVLDSNNIQDIEYVQIEIDAERYYIINILKMISGSLDLKKSIIMRYPSDCANEYVRGKIGAIWKPVLYKKKIQGHIFRIEEHPSDVFVDEYFKCLIEKNGFTGIDFELIELS